MLKGLEGVQEHWNQCRARLYNGGQTLTDVSAAIGETPVTRLMTEEINSSLESHQLLSLLMDVRDLLEPLSQAAKEKRKLLETIQQHGEHAHTHTPKRTLTQSSIHKSQSYRAMSVCARHRALCTHTSPHTNVHLANNAVYV